MPPPLKIVKDGDAKFKAKAGPSAGKSESRIRKPAPLKTTRVRHPPVLGTQSPNIESITSYLKTVVVFHP
jgi:hypothetical protein